jgi:hypothetical protein
MKQCLLIINVVVYAICVCTVTNTSGLVVSSSSNEEKPVKQVIVDLKSLLGKESTLTDDGNKQSEQELHKYELASGVHIKSARLYSDQLDESYLSGLFRLSKNETSVTLLRGDGDATKSIRRRLCMSMKYCKMKQHQCMLSLNHIIYMTSSSSSSPFSSDSSIEQSIARQTQHRNPDKINVYFDMIKLVKLNLIVSDFGKENNLVFDKAGYEFDMHMDASRPGARVGRVRATLIGDNERDLSALVKYYVVYSEEDRVFLSDLIGIDERTGWLSISKQPPPQPQPQPPNQQLDNDTKTFNMRSLKQEYAFHVEALLQCSLGQKPLTNRTRVTLRMHAHKSMLRPVMRVTALAEPRRIATADKNDSVPFECVRLGLNDVSKPSSSATVGTGVDDGSVPLAQIIVENGDHSQQSSLNASYSLKVNVHSLQQRTIAYAPSAKLHHLIENIYVLYVSKSDSAAVWRLDYVNNFYTLNVQLFDAHEANLLQTVEICLCIGGLSRLPDTLDAAAESMSTLAFDKSVYEIGNTLGSALTISYTSLANSAAVHVGFYIDDLNDNTSVSVTPIADSFIISNITTTNSTTQLTLSVANPITFKRRQDNLEQIKYRYQLLIVVESTSAPSSKLRGLKSDNASVRLKDTYKNLLRLSNKSGKLLQFVSTLLISMDNETQVNDSSQSWRTFDARSAQLAAQSTARSWPTNLVEFYVSTAILVNNSIIGHLPDIAELLGSSATATAAAGEHNRYDDAYYELMYTSLEQLKTHKGCFRVGKYDGIVYYMERENESNKSVCFANAHMDVGVGLRVPAEANGKAERLTHLLRLRIHATNATLKSDQAVNLLYDATNSRALAEQSVETTSEFDLTFQLNLRNAAAVVTTSTSNPMVRLINLISNFGASSSRLLVNNVNIDVRTRYELTAVSTVTATLGEAEAQRSKSNANYKDKDRQQQLFLLDTKKNSIYLNISDYLSSVNSLSTCYQLSIQANNYVYYGWPKRKLIGSDKFKINLCLLSEQDDEGDAASGIKLYF